MYDVCDSVLEYCVVLLCPLLLLRGIRPSEALIENKEPNLPKKLDIETFHLQCGQ